MLQLLELLPPLLLLLEQLLLLLLLLLELELLELLLMELPLELLLELLLEQLLLLLLLDVVLLARLLRGPRRHGRGCEDACRCDCSRAAPIVFRSRGGHALPDLGVHGAVSELSRLRLTGLTHAVAALAHR